MSTTIATSSSPPGAGRSLDANIEMRAGTTAQLSVAFSGTARTSIDNRVSGGGSWNGGGSFTNTGTTNFGTQLQRTCNRYGTAGNAGTCTGPLNLVFPIVQPVNDLQDDAAWNNWRYIFTICRTGIGAGPTDSGISFATNSATMSSIFNPSISPTVGFGAFFDATGNLWWASRPDNTPNVPAPDLVQLTTDTCLQWHEIEFRFQGAQLGANATAVVVVDGIETVRRDWGVGTDLPTPTSFGSDIYGFGLMLGKNAQAYVDSIYFSQIRVIAAPTFEALF